MRCSILVVGSLLVACSSGSGADNPASGGTGGSAGNIVSGGAGGTAGSAGTGAAGSAGSASLCPPGASGAGGGGPQICTPPGYSAAATPQHVDRANARIVDLDGNAVEGEIVSVCGTDLCVKGGVTASDGTAAVIANVEFLTPAFKYGLGFAASRFAYPLPAGQTVYALGDVVTARLPDVCSGADLVAGGDATSSGATITLAANANVDIDGLTYIDPALHRFRAAPIPIAKAPPAVDPALGFELLWAMTPLETKFCPAAKLTVPNSESWPANTVVEFYIHGLEVLQEWAPYAGWAKVSEGAVSADGATISTDDAGGIPLLSNVGIKRKP